MKPVISIIVAHDNNLGIGKQGKLPWHISSDLKRFKSLTINHPIIMGRKTHESIGRVLPQRANIIITRNKNYSTKYSDPDRNIFIAHSLQKAINLAKAKDRQEIFIIGGGELYKQALPLADKLYITKVKGNFNCDTFFPTYQNFKLKKSQSNQEKNLSFQYLELTK